MSFKDHFSSLAAQYARFRPTYPPALFEFLAGLCAGHVSAWDCACGSGQATVHLAQRFQRVIGTDASAKQIETAQQARGVTYRVAPAEASGLESDSVDLVTVAQALHWLDLDRFYPEVERVLHGDGIFAAWSYGSLGVDGAEIDRLIQHFYAVTVGPYWPPERTLVEEGYRTLRFPFPEVVAPPFEIRESWTLERVMGYLRSWSATGRYVEAHGTDPVSTLETQVRPLWGDSERQREITWPVKLRVGRRRVGAGAPLSEQPR